MTGSTIFSLRSTIFANCNVSCRLLPLAPLPHIVPAASPDTEIISLAAPWNSQPCYDRLLRSSPLIERTHIPPIAIAAALCPPKTSQHSIRNACTSSPITTRSSLPDAIEVRGASSSSADRLYGITRHSDILPFPAMDSIYHDSPHNDYTPSI